MVDGKIKPFEFAVVSPDCSQCPILCSTSNCPCIFPGTNELIYPRITPTIPTTIPANCELCPQPLCKCSFNECTPEIIREFIG